MEGHCLIKDRLGQLHTGKRNHDYFFRLLWFITLKVQQWSFTSGEREGKKSFKGFVLLDFSESLQHIVFARVQHRCSSLSLIIYYRHPHSNTNALCKAPTKYRARQNLCPASLQSKISKSQSGKETSICKRSCVKITWPTTRKIWNRKRIP